MQETAAIQKNSLHESCIPTFKWNKTLVITALVGTILLALGVVLRFYPGIGNGAMATILSIGTFLILTAIYLAKKEEAKALPPAPDPLDALFTAIDTDNVVTIIQEIQKYKETCPTLLTATNGKKQNACEYALQRALEGHEPTGVVVEMIRKESGIKDNTPYFIRICQHLLKKEEAEVTPLEKHLLILFAPSDYDKAIDDLKRVSDQCLRIQALDSHIGYFLKPRGLLEEMIRQKNKTKVAELIETHKILHGLFEVAMEGFEDPNKAITSADVEVVNLLISKKVLRNTVILDDVLTPFLVIALRICKRKLTEEPTPEELTLLKALKDDKPGYVLWEIRGVFVKYFASKEPYKTMQEDGKAKHLLVGNRIEQLLKDS